MKYLLTPFTLLIMFLLSYFGIYLAVFGMALVFSLGWFLLIIGYLILLSAIGAIFSGIPTLLNVLIMVLYGTNRFLRIIHSLAGLFGVILIITFFIHNPPNVVSGTDSVFIISGMWQVSPFRTIILVPIFTGAILSIVWTTVAVPVLSLFEN